MTFPQVSVSNLSPSLKTRDLSSSINLELPVLENYNAISAVVVFGGSGYIVDDVLTLIGGIQTIAAEFTVTSAIAGVVTGVRLTRTGNYTFLPPDPVSTTGSGDDLCTLEVSWNIPGKAVIIVLSSDIKTSELSSNIKT